MKRTEKKAIDAFVRMIHKEAWNGTGAARGGGGGQSMIGVFTALGRAAYTSETLNGLALTTDGYNPSARVFSTGPNGAWATDFNYLTIRAASDISDSGGEATPAFAPRAVVDQLNTWFLDRNQTRLERIKKAGTVLDMHDGYMLPNGVKLLVDNFAPANTIYMMDLAEAIELVDGNESATSKKSEEDDMAPIMMECEWLDPTQGADDVWTFRIRSHLRQTIRKPQLISIITTAA